MNIVPNPIALQIGPLTVRWYGILIMSGALIGLFFAMREAARQQINPEHFLDLLLYGFPISVVAARLYYVVFEWETYKNAPFEAIKVWHGGLAIHGALIGAVLTGCFFTRKRGLSFWKIADVAAPSIIFAQAVGRWGNFFNQEAFGYPTDLPWGLYIAPQNRPPGYENFAYFHPTFLYESLWDLGVFLLLLWFRRRKGVRQGEVFFTYLIAYSIGRFFVEGLRTDSLMLGPYLRAAQVVSLILIVLSLAMIWVRRRFYRLPYYDTSGQVVQQ